MTVAATIQGSPLATPSQLATQPSLGQAAATVGGRITPQALTANGEAQFRPQQLPNQTEQTTLNRGAVQFTPQGSGGAAPAAGLGQAATQAAAANNASLPNNAAQALAGSQNNAAFVAQLVGQNNGVLAGNALALVTAIAGALQTSLPGSPKGIKLPATASQAAQQLRDMRVAQGQYNDNVARTTAAKANSATSAAAPTSVAAAPAQPAAPEAPRQALPANRDLPRIQAANKQYRATQISAQPPIQPPLPEGVTRSTIS